MKKTLKILIVNDDFPPYSFGGAGMIAFRHASLFHEKGHQVSVITSLSPGLSPGLSPHPFPLYTIPSDYHPRFQAYLSLWNPQTVFAFKRLIESLQPDIVHFHNIHYHLSYQCLKIASRCSSHPRVFVSLHDVMSFSYGKFDQIVDQVPPLTKTFPSTFNYKLSWLTPLKKARWRYNPLRNLWIRSALRSATRLLPVSSALATALVQNKISPVEVVPNGIDLQSFDAVSSESVLQFKTKYQLQDKKILFFGGRFGVAKGSRVLEQILPPLVASYPSLCLVVAASEDSASRQFLQKMQALGLDSSLVLTGWLSMEEMRIAYKSSDICITPSVCFDSFPNANLEAHAARKPVIATCFGGSSELVIHGETGFIVHPLHTADLVEKILFLLHHPEVAQSFGERGYQRIQEHFLLEHQYQKFLALYEQSSRISLLEAGSIRLDSE